MIKFWIPPKLSYYTTHNFPYVLNYYIYEWRDNNIPFYIGMGHSRRAWNDHLPLPENRRRVAQNFRVVILRHNLTKPQAHLIERHHITALTNRGIVLLNERIPNVSLHTKERRINHHHLPNR
jgi:hypothetical protein